jgi:hypothetical protein
MELDGVGFWSERVGLAGFAFAFRGGEEEEEDEDEGKWVRTGDEERTAMALGNEPLLPVPGLGFESPWELEAISAIPDPVVNPDNRLGFASGVFNTIVLGNRDDD